MKEIFQINIIYVLCVQISHALKHRLISVAVCRVGGEQLTVIGGTGGMFDI